MEAEWNRDPETGRCEYRAENADGRCAKYSEYTSTGAECRIKCGRAGRGSSAVGSDCAERDSETEQEFERTFGGRTNQEEVFTVGGDWRRVVCR